MQSEGGIAGKQLSQQLLRLSHSFTAGFSSHLPVSAKAQAESVRTRQSTFPLPPAPFVLHEDDHGREEEYGRWMVQLEILITQY